MIDKEALTMKRIFSLLLAIALLAALAGCRKREPAPDRPDEPVPPEEEGIVLAELNVEFSTGTRDMDELMRLKKEFSPLLIAALGEEGVKVGKVNVTFGTSDEATADALAHGTVQVGFVPMETYAAHAEAMRAVCVSDEGADGVERIGLYLPASDQSRTLRADFEKNAAHSSALSAWSTLLGGFWMGNGVNPVFAVPAEDEAALRFLDSMMDINGSGMTAESIPHLIEYTDADTALSDAELVVLHSSGKPDEGLWTEVYSCPLGGGVVAVSTADDIVNSDEFAAALCAAMEAVSADETAQTVLRLYDGDGARYSAADTQTLEFAQYLLGNAEGVYQLTSE